MMHPRHTQKEFARRLLSTAANARSLALSSTRNGDSTMRRFLYAATLAVMTFTSAFAADLPIKVPKPQAFAPYPTNGCGLYYGVNVTSVAASIQDGPVGATAVGGAVGGTLGYACAIPANSTFWFVEALGDFQNLNGASNGFSLTGPVHLQQRLGFGGPLNELLPSLIPNLNLPAVPALPGLPAGVTAGAAKPYIYAALTEDDISASFGLASAHAWRVSPGGGIGVLTRLSNNVVVDTWAGVRMQSSGLCLGASGICPKLGTGFETGVSLKW